MSTYPCRHAERQQSQDKTPRGRGLAVELAPLCSALEGEAYVPGAEQGFGLRLRAAARGLTES